MVAIPGPRHIHRGGAIGGGPVGIGTDTHKRNIEIAVLVVAAAACAATAGSQCPHGEVAVVGAAPAPVDIELVLRVIAVEHKAVAAGARTRIENGAALVKLCTEICRILLVVVVVTPVCHHVGSVLEILHQRGLRGGMSADVTENVVVSSSTAAIDSKVVVHLVGHAQMIHQRGDSVNLAFAAGGSQRGGHRVPLVCGGAKVSRLHAKFHINVLMIIAVAAVARGRIVPVLHHLRRGCGDTAGHHAMVTRILFLLAIGAEIVVNGILVPSSAQQRTHRRANRRQRHLATHQPAPLLCHLETPLHQLVPGLRLFPFLETYFLLIAFEPDAHMLGHSLGVETARQRPAQHRNSTVVTAHQDKTALGSSKDIKLRERSLCRYIRQLCRFLHTHRPHISVGHSPRRRGIHRTGLGHTAQQQHKRQKKQHFLHYYKFLNLLNNSIICNTATYTIPSHVLHTANIHLPLEKTKFFSLPHPDIDASYTHHRRTQGEV